MPVHSALGGSRGSAFLVTTRLCGPDAPKKSLGRARAIATTGVLCSPALGESDTYPAVSGGGGGAENRNAPNDTAALGFVENSEAARHVFVVVVIGDVMIGGRRYVTFVLAWVRGAVKPTRAIGWLLDQAAPFAAFKKKIPRGAQLESRGTHRPIARPTDSLGGRKPPETGAGRCAPRDSSCAPRGRFFFWAPLLVEEKRFA